MADGDFAGTGGLAAWNTLTAAVLTALASLRSEMPPSFLRDCAQPGSGPPTILGRSTLDPMKTPNQDPE